MCQIKSSITQRLVEKRVKIICAWKTIWEILTFLKSFETSTKIIEIAAVWGEFVQASLSSVYVVSYEVAAEKHIL